MYTLTFGTPTVGTGSATLPFTLDGTVSDGPYVGTASATGGGETKTGDVTVDANSATGEIVFTGLSAGTTYTIAQGEIDITYGGNDQSLAHGGISFITKATGYDTPMAATQEQWEDLAARVKAKADSSDVPSTYWGQTASNGAVTGDLTLNTHTAHGDAEITSGATLQDGVSVSLTAGGSDIVTARSYTDTQSQVSISTIELGGTIDAGSNQINNLAAGTANTDAVNKSQLDAKPTITMTSTDPGEGSALAANNYVAVYGGDPIILDYSTSEINTGVKWINGSAIYKKTINIGALPNSTTKNTAHNISNLGQVLRIEGFTTNGTNTYELPRVMIGGTQYQAQIQVNSTNIQIDTGDDLSSYTTTYVTLYYTKSS